MNKLSTEKRSQVVSALVEGNSIRATVRMTGVSKNTIAKLLSELGEACADYLDKALVNLNCKRIQCDEIWSFCYAKDKNVPEKLRGTFGYGDVWTWTAMDAESKLIVSWLVGGRDAGTAYGFMDDLSKRLANRVQLTTDGHRAYLSAVEEAFGSEIDYAMLVKLYGASDERDTRYSPPECISCRQVEISGHPDPKHISTSHVERQNLTMRMQMRRFTRLTNAFSKKIENHIASIAIHFMHYNFCRVHQSLRVTPAMEAHLTDHVWTIDEMLSILDSKENTKNAA
ncbi:MAG TPA: IS1 family transposase [Candidatus Acidoferrales bacterium]|nr:IS1 family transposase [Candidatus Acidoferrales bacterium]